MAGNIVIGVLRAVLTADTAEFVGGMRKASSDLGKFEKDLGKFGTAVSGVGTAMLPMTAAIAGIGAAAISSGVDFERSMNSIKGVLRPTGTELEAIREKAIQLGADTAFSAKDAADAMLELGKAGFGVQETMSATGDVLQLAAASGLSMSEAAEMAARTISAFGLETSDLAHVNDVLAKAVNASTLEISDLQTAFGYVGPIAQSFGMSIEQASAALAIMRDNGIAAETSGRALREGMSRLANPVKSVQEVMQSLGISTFESGGKLMNLSEIVAILESKNITAAESLKLFGDAAGPGMFTLVQQGRSALDGLTQDLKDSGGAAKDMADAMMSGLPGAFERMKGSIETALISIAKAIEPFVIRIADAIGGIADFISNTLVPAFNALPPVVQTGVIGLTAFAAALGPLLIALGSMATGLKSVIGLFAMYQGAQVAATTATVAGTTATAGFSASVAAAGVALRATLATLGPVAVAVASVTAAVTAGYQAWKLYRESQERAAYADKLAAQDKANLDRINRTLGTSYTDLNQAVAAARDHAAALRDKNLALRQEQQAQAAASAVQRTAIDQTTGSMRVQVGAIEALQARTEQWIDALLFEMAEIDRTAKETAQAAQAAFGQMVDALLLEVAELERARTESMARADAAAQQYLASELDAFKKAKDEETAYRRLQSEIANEIGLAQMEAERQRLEQSKINWLESLASISEALAQMGQIGMGVIGELSRGFGTLIASINAGVSSVKSFGSGLKQMTSGSGLASVIGGFAQMATGIGGIVSAASAAISAVKGIWNAISGAFQSEETKHVNKPRDAFFEQYGGYAGLAEKLTAASDGNVADGLIRQLYDADTKAKFDAAQDAIIRLIGGNKFRVGTPGLGFMNFDPAGELAVLHGREAVVPEGRAGEFAARFGDGDTSWARELAFKFDDLRNEFRAWRQTAHLETLSLAQTRAR